MRCIYLAVVLLALGGCAYKVAPVTVDSLNLYSSYQSKYPGTYAVVIDKSLLTLSREIKPASMLCSAHSYPTVAGPMMGTSARTLANSLFEKTVEVATAPTREIMTRHGYAGSVLLKLDRFSPRLVCSDGFPFANCSASTEVLLGVAIESADGTTFATSASGSKTHDAGGGCSEAGSVVAESISGATKDALERLGERINNADRLRGTIEKGR